MTDQLTIDLRPVADSLARAGFAVSVDDLISAVRSGEYEITWGPPVLDDDKLRRHGLTPPLTGEERAAHWREVLAP